MDDPSRRLADAGAQLQQLRPALEAREPWPLSAAHGTEPEADWGPREVLAHVVEMLDYWVVELRRVVAGGDGSVAFGRVASDPARLARIDAARQQTAGRLLDEVDRGVSQAKSFVAGLSPADLERLGAHPTRGDIPVGAAIDRFLLTHLEEHVAQLQAILARPPAG